MNVSITMVRALVAAAERSGTPREQLLRAAGLEPRQLDDAHGQLTLADFSRVQIAVLELSKDPAFGLHFVEHASPQSFELLGHLLVQAATLRHAIGTLSRYATIVTPGPGPMLREEGDTASVRFGFRRDASLEVRFAAELSVSGLLRMLRAFVAPDVQPRGVYFAYEAPDYRAEYTRIFGGLEHFEHPFTGIEFERAWLDRKQLHDNAELYSVLQTQAERALSRITRDAALANRLKAHLAAHAPRQMPTMEEVARAFDMSARSLRRRLLVEGVLYKDLVEEVLTSTAKRMLEDPHTSIQETAYALGFARPAGFHRAFKRWTGMTPKRYKASY